MTDEERVAELASDIQCGTPLARDLLKLAGGDASLVCKASEACHNVASLKVYIINERFKKLEG